VVDPQPKIAEVVGSFDILVRLVPPPIDPGQNLFQILFGLHPGSSWKKFTMEIAKNAEAVIKEKTKG
jgi:hypothetical protein